jgi:dolichol kinase
MKKSLIKHNPPAKASHITSRSLQVIQKISSAKLPLNTVRTSCARRTFCLFPFCRFFADFDMPIELLTGRAEPSQLVLESEGAES